MVLLELKLAFEDQGAAVVVATTLEQGLDQCDEGFDAAILERQLPDGDVFPLADKLTRQHTHLLFHADGLQNHEIAQRFPDALTFAKPANEGRLVDALRHLVDPALA